MKVKANIKINEWGYDIEGDTNDVMVTFKNHSGTPTKAFLTVKEMEIIATQWSNYKNKD